MPDQPQPDRPKIIIDEDWKSQVQAEKEQLAREQAQKQQQPSTPEPDEDHPLPPASFELLVTTLVTEAMVSLGQFPHPVTNKHELHLNQAKHFIDTLGVLEEKTAGNLSPQESAMLGDVLHQLRMAYVTLGRAAAKS